MGLFCDSGCMFYLCVILMEICELGWCCFFICFCWCEMFWVGVCKFFQHTTKQQVLLYNKSVLMIATRNKNRQIGHYRTLTDIYPPTALQNNANTNTTTNTLTTPINQTPLNTHAMTMYRSSSYTVKPA